MIANISLWKNANKKNEKQPDYHVTAKIGDKFVEIGAGWIKKTTPTESHPDGRTYLSVSFKGNVKLEERLADGRPVPFPDDPVEKDF